VLIRQRIEQLIEFLNDAFGVNSLGGAHWTDSFASNRAIFLAVDRSAPQFVD